MNCFAATPHSSTCSTAKRKRSDACSGPQQRWSKHGIHDVFQDNGGKILQVLLVTGLTVIPGREGNDPRDAAGNEYELKSVNRLDTRGRPKRNPQFTTHHHLNPKIIEKYRQVDSLFAVYSGIELESVYLMTPEMLEPCNLQWEQEYIAKGDLNNPKIKLRFVEDQGILVFRSDGSTTRAVSK